MFTLDFRPPDFHPSYKKCHECGAINYTVISFGDRNSCINCSARRDGIIQFGKIKKRPG